MLLSFIIFGCMTTVIKGYIMETPRISKHAPISISKINHMILFFCRMSNMLENFLAIRISINNLPLNSPVPIFLLQQQFCCSLSYEPQLLQIFPLFLLKTNLMYTNPELADNYHHFPKSPMA